MLEIPKSLQEDDYSCGAHCIKMLADYYKIKNKNGQLHTFRNIKKICNTTVDGTEIKDLDKGLKKLGLIRVRTTLDKILKNGVKRPILTLIKDETPYTEHYVLIDGTLSESMISIADPIHHYFLKYIGSEQAKNLIVKFDSKHWLWEIRKGD